MKKLLFVLPIVLLIVGCQAGPFAQKISQLQKKVDEIAAKVESSEGLKAKGGTEAVQVKPEKIEEIEKSLATLEKKIDELGKKIDEIGMKVDKLDSRYTSHLKKYHR